MIVACPSCHKKIKAPDSAAGKKAKCPSCGTVMMLPAAVQDAEVINQDIPLPPPPGPLSTPLGGGGISDLLDEADEMYSLEKKPGGTGLSSSDPFASSGPAPSVLDSGVPRRPCPACGEMIIMSALKCRFCGEAFDPGLKRKQKRGGSGFGEDDDLTGTDLVIAILCGNIGCILGIIWMIQGKPKGMKMIGVSVLAQIGWGILSVVLQSIG